MRGRLTRRAFVAGSAAAALPGNSEAGKKTDLKPRARIRAFANIGSEPAIMLTGPVDVTKKVLKRAGMTLADIVFPAFLFIVGVSIPDQSI